MPIQQPIEAPVQVTAAQGEAVDALVVGEVSGDVDEELDGQVQEEHGCCSGRGLAHRAVSGQVKVGEKSGKGFRLRAGR